MKSVKGITLIALVITIIILLILAGISIATVTGENGILTKASEARRESEIASVKEQAQIDITNWIIRESGNGGDTTEISVANYGDRVNYVSKGDSSLIWRIFYDDENYVYLISSKADGSNTVESYNFMDFTEMLMNYSGSTDITDTFLQSLATNSSVYSISTACNGIYNNGTNWWIASPAYGGMDDYGGHMMYMLGNSNDIQPAMISEKHGLRPMVIIPKANFTYQIIEENE